VSRLDERLTTATQSEPRDDDFPMEIDVGGEGGILYLN
jgi:hypothetical protein